MGNISGRYINPTQLAKQSTYLLLTGLLFFSIIAHAQGDPVRRGLDRANQLGSQVRQMGNSQGGDSLQRRDRFADSITIRFRYLDSTRSYPLDSSINDFTVKYPIPATHIYLSNTGQATRSILFSPRFTAGWDPGFHALDVYKWKLEKARFFNSTRPYSELNYIIGSRAEQIIEVMHTQNIKPNWNFMFNYRMINSPGFFKNVKTSHNNYALTSWYKSNNQRYNLYFALLANKMQASEGGGIRDDKDYLNDPIYKDRYNIDTKIGGDNPLGRDFFNTRIGTGNKHSEFSVLLRQQYDLGRKDSIVTDSSVIPLFYPRLRFEHTLTYNTYKYVFADVPFATRTALYTPDSAYYKDNYGMDIPASDSIYFRDIWKEIINDFSIYQFPDAKNQQQFIKLGAAIQNLTGEFAALKKTFYNVFGHAEYRNKTRNLKWDIEANGKLYFTGFNAGDYQAYASLQRFIGKKIGYLQLGFENANRTPSFIYDSRSSFYLLSNNVDFKKENSTHFFASLHQPASRLRLTGHYYLMTNYTFIRHYYQLSQENALFNVLQVALQKTIPIGKRWVWHADIYFQQVVGNAPVNLPQIFTRNRIGYEGNLGLKNLNIAFGGEVRYHTPYKADGYSPVLGQFFYQDSIRIRNKLPDIAAYLHLRIRSFKLFVRAENLNTAGELDGFGFVRNNLAAPGYAYPGLVIRVGIFWNFVN